MHNLTSGSQKSVFLWFCFLFRILEVNHRRGQNLCEAAQLQRFLTRAVLKHQLFITITEILPFIFMTEIHKQSSVTALTECFMLPTCELALCCDDYYTVKGSVQSYVNTKL